jgi:hypothetical protein
VSNYFRMGVSNYFLLTQKCMFCLTISDWECLTISNWDWLPISEWQCLTISVVPNLWSKNHVLKKVGRGSSHDLFSNWYFLNLHALRCSKPVTVFLYIKFGSTSPAAWCVLSRWWHKNVNLLSGSYLIT